MADYLSLLMSANRAAEHCRRLAAAREIVTYRRAKDILRGVALLCR